jgi:hypothetical protein
VLEMRYFKDKDEASLGSFISETLRLHNADGVYYRLI